MNQQDHERNVAAFNTLWREYCDLKTECEALRARVAMFEKMSEKSGLKSTTNSDLPARVQCESPGERELPGRGHNHWSAVTNARYHGGD